MAALPIDGEGKRCLFADGLVEIRKGFDQGLDSPGVLCLSQEICGILPYLRIRVFMERLDQLAEPLFLKFFCTFRLFGNICVNHISH